MTLERYLVSKGYRLKWVAQQVGMNYSAFWQFLMKNSSLSFEHAKAIEQFTQGDWKAVPNKSNRLTKRWMVIINLDS